MRHKTKALSALLGLALTVGLFPTFSIPVRAEEETPETSSEPTTNYIITIPATLTVENSGWNPIGSISVEGTLVNNDGQTDKLTVTATSENEWKLKQQSGSETIAYELKETAGGGAKSKWDFISFPAEQTIGIDVADYSNNSIGTYADTVTFTAAVETKYTVTFDKCGHGNETINPQQIVSGGKVSKPDDLTTSELLDFGGWFKDAACTQAWNFNTDTVTGPTTLYAKWAEQQQRTLNIEVKHIEIDLVYDEDSGEYREGQVTDPEYQSGSVEYYPHETWVDAANNNRVWGITVDEYSGIVDLYSLSLSGKFSFNAYDKIADFVTEHGSDVKIVYTEDKCNNTDSASEVPSF